MKTEEDKTKLVEIFTGSLWQAELIKSMLEDNNIEASLKNAYVVLPETGTDVSIMVHENVYENAMQVIRTYEQNEHGA